MGAGTWNSFSISTLPPGILRSFEPAQRRELWPSMEPPLASTACRSSGAPGGGSPIVDGAEAVLEEPALPATLDGNDLGHDGRRDLLGALGADVQAGRAVDPGQVVPGDRRALLSELGQKSLGSRA